MYIYRGRRPEDESGIYGTRLTLELRGRFRQYYLQNSALNLRSKVVCTCLGQSSGE